MVHKVEKRALFRSHHHLDKEYRNFRWWLYFKERDILNIEIAWLSHFFGLGLSTREGKWTLNIRLALLAFYVSVPGKYRNYGDDREIDISFHDWALWWRFWTDPMSWSSDTPKWRDGSFHMDRFLLGKTTCEHRTIEKRDVMVPMPERAYPATAKLEEWTWRRPRWFKKTVMLVEIEIPEGIPFPGKGTSSWNCGDDATYSMTTGPCRSIAEGVGMLVGSALRDRVRNGGYSDWTWKREPQQT